MSNVTLKNQPKITLEQVLRRRKTTLKKYVNEVGVQTYAGLVVLCNRLGVTPPDEEKYNAELAPVLVTSQQDGVVVIGGEDDTNIELQPILNEEKPKKQRRTRVQKPDETTVTEKDEQHTETTTDRVDSERLS